MKYSNEWFSQRAWNSLKKVDEGVWDYSDSLLMYIGSGSQEYEDIQEETTDYYRLVTQPEHEYLELIAEDVVSHLPDTFDYIDLGPGTEHKEKYFFDAIHKQGKKCTYIPVDIDENFLSIAESFANEQGIQAKGIKASFEELPQILPDEGKPRFVSIGMTFSNWESQYILEMLKQIASTNGYIFFNAQIRDRIDMATLQNFYSGDSLRMSHNKLALLNLNPQIDVADPYVDEAFKFWYSIKNPSQRLLDMGCKKGDKLLVFQSLRYSKEQLEEVFSEEDFTLFDTGHSFIAALIKT